MKQFLILSDLHFREKWDEEIGPVFDSLLKDIKIELNPQNDNYLIFCGDLVQSGNESSLFEILDRSFSETLISLGISRERRFVVPGNHDIQRKVIEDNFLIHRGCLSLIKEQKQFNDNFSSQLEKTFSAKFENFNNFLSVFTSNIPQDLSGDGFEIDDQVSLYCLNSAIASFGGIVDPSTNKPISDERSLMVETRKINKWLLSNKNKFKILVMHHPLEWLCEWAKNEIEQLIQVNFDLVISGHIHQPNSINVSSLSGTSAFLSCPPLFTRKHESLGYSILSITDDNEHPSIKFKQWIAPKHYVLGTAFSKNDTGIIELRTQSASQIDTTRKTERKNKGASIYLLKKRFLEAATCFSSYSGYWVERDFSRNSESSSSNEDDILVGVDELIKSDENTLIVAPVNFGITCVGHRIALRYKEIRDKNFLHLRGDFQPHESAVTSAIENGCLAIGCEISDLDGIILDNVEFDKNTRRKINTLRVINAKWTIIALHTLDGSARFDNIGMPQVFEGYHTWHLWSLTRERVRELVSLGYSSNHVLDEETLFQKVISDLDALNLHRTPLNCLTLVKTNENQVEETPVNRTELIKRVFSLYFNQFNNVPRYNTRPDLLDCEYGIGFFVEILIRRDRFPFSKDEFITKISAFAKRQKIPIEVDVLFEFLASEKIVVKRHDVFEFRFAHWLYFFAAHRMYQSEEFCDYMLSDRRYARFPEIMEFYSGMDRRRENAVTTTIADLRQMNASVLSRTGLSESFNPYSSAKWLPTGKVVEAIGNEICEEVEKSNLPQNIKDAIADQSYDRKRAYNQEVQAFVKSSTFPELFNAVRGAARTLRNSDYVDPDLRAELLSEVVLGWRRVTQVLALIAPVLGQKGHANYEGMGFYVKDLHSVAEQDRLSAIVSAIPSNIVNWFQEDIFSKKLGLLVLEFLEQDNDVLSKMLLRRIAILHAPDGWYSNLEKFMIREQKNSFYLHDTFSALRHQQKVGALSNIKQYKQLSAIALAKHWSGQKKLSSSYIKQALKQLENDKTRGD